MTQLTRNAQRLLICIGIVGAFSCEDDKSERRKASKDAKPGEANSESDPSAAVVPPLVAGGATDQAANAEAEAEAEAEGTPLDKLDKADPPAGALPLEKKKRVYFQGSKACKIPGYLWLPARQAGAKLPAALLTYALDENKDSPDVATLAEAFAKAGIVSLTYDRLGQGERSPSAKKTFAGAPADLCHEVSADDAILNDAKPRLTAANDEKAALKYLAGLAEVDADKIGSVGIRLGSSIGLIVGADESTGVKAMVTILSRNFPNWASAAPVLKIAEVAPRPTLCFSSELDSDLGSATCDSAGENGEQQAIRCTTALAKCMTQIVTKSTEFLVKHLK